MACEKLPTCIFFNDHMEKMPGVADLLKTQYCRGAFEECARFRVAAKVGGPTCPATSTRTTRLGPTRSWRLKGEVTTSEWGLARPEGFEPPASWFEAKRSIRVSYGRPASMIAHRGRRTRDAAEWTRVRGVIPRRGLTKT